MRRIRYVHTTLRRNKDKLKPFFLVSFKGVEISQSDVDELDVVCNNLEDVLKGKSQIIIYDSSIIDIKFVEPEATKNKKTRRIRL